MFESTSVKTMKELLEALKYIHSECNRLCKNAFGSYLPNAGNIAFFCHFQDEFENLVTLRKELTYPSDNPDQKYFRLRKPITFAEENSVPQTTYSYLYIRRPREDSPQVGDIDFYLSDEEFLRIKNDLLAGKVIPGVRIYDRVDLDMLELYDPTSDVLPYVSTQSMVERVRVKQSEETVL